MIVLNPNKCTGCGVCAKICHEHCITLVDDVMRIDDAFCSLCTQCIAVCPQQALSWNQVPSATYEPARLPSPEQLDELFKQRRTIRHFKQDKLNRSLLEEIVSQGIYAPAHSFSFRAILVDEKEIIDLVDATIMRFTSRFYRFFFKPPFIHHLIKWIMPGYEPEYIKLRPKLESGLEAGRALQSRPAALLFIVGDRRVPLSEPSAQYVLYNMNLYAQAKGVGCRNLVGNQMILNRSQALRKRLGLAKHERIYGTMGLGYPAVRFQNKVMGRTMKIQWNDGR